MGALRVISPPMVFIVGRTIDNTAANGIADLYILEISKGIMPLKEHSTY